MLAEIIAIYSYGAYALVYFPKALTYGFYDLFNCIYQIVAETRPAERFGPGRDQGRIFLDEVDCNGTELQLTDCTHNGAGVHDCDHTGDAGVVCKGK